MISSNAEKQAKITWLCSQEYIMVILYLHIKCKQENVQKVEIIAKLVKKPDYNKLS